MGITKKFLKNLHNYSRKKKLKSAAPHFIDAVDELEKYIDFYKIASYELLWKDLFLKCIEKKKKLIYLFTGMANMKKKLKMF